MWLDFNKIISYGALLNFVVAERGVGKSYGAKKYIVNHFKKKHKQTCYIRRYVNQIEDYCYFAKHFGTNDNHWVLTKSEAKQFWNVRDAKWTIKNYKLKNCEVEK